MNLFRRPNFDDAEQFFDVSGFVFNASLESLNYFNTYRAVASASRTTGLRYIYESREGRIMLMLWQVTQGKPPG
jgi:hypothetical protein